jgi:hypothetical protein
MLKRLWILMLIGATCASQWACAPLAAGVAGAAVGHEIAEEEDEDDHDRD